MSRSPAWTMRGCYVSPFPVVIGQVYDPATGEQRLMRRHLFPPTSHPAEPPVVPCKPTLCRECERERAWHDHGEPRT